MHGIPTPRILLNVGDVMTLPGFAKRPPDGIFKKHHNFQYEVTDGTESRWPL